MMHQETENKRELRFVCPNCGDTRLLIRSESYTQIDHVYEDGDTEWGRVKNEEMSYLCESCGYGLEFDDENDIAEWLKTHCNQDEPGARNDQEDNSGVPSKDAG